MTNLQIFNFEGNEVRTTFMKETVYFNLNDVCAVLDIKNTSDAKSRLKKDGVGSADVIDSLGRKQVANFVNEPNLYRLIFQSRKASAERFQDWVTSEVLPSIRNHGAYMTNDTIEKAITDPDFLIRLATNLKEEKSKRLEAEQKIEAQRPKVLFAEAVQTSKNSILVKDLATLLKQKGLDIGQNRLFEWLRDNGYLLCKGSYYNKPSQKAMNLELFETKTHIHTDRNGVMVTSYTPKVTGKGQVYFINKLLEESNEVMIR